MFDWVKSGFTVLRGVGYLKRIAISLESLAESQMLTLKLQCILRDIPIDSLREATYEPGEGEVLIQSDKELNVNEELYARYKKHTGQDPPVDMSLMDMEEELR